MDGEMLEQNLKCPICLTIAEEPYETNCCGHIFCHKCLKGIANNICPICRSNKVFFRENTFVANLLNSIQVKCPHGCELKISMSNVKLHRFQCDSAIFKCSVISNSIKCNFEGIKKDSLLHFAEKHSDQMIVLAEHYASMKNTYDKYSLFDKLLKIEKEDIEAKSGQEEKVSEYDEFFFHNLYNGNKYADKLKNNLKIKELPNINEINILINNSKSIPDIDKITKK